LRLAFLNEPGRLRGVLVFVELGDQDIGTFAGMAAAQPIPLSSPVITAAGLPVSRAERRTDHEALLVVIYCATLPEVRLGRTQPHHARDPQRYPPVAVDRGDIRVRERG